MGSRRRLDHLLVERGVCSREQARRLIMAGAVRVGDRIVDKPGALVAHDSEIRVESASEESKFVSRGGAKLQAALDHFQIDVSNAVVLDVGASTGGFTDCVLQRGARAVIAVDVGYGQLAWKLRSDPRVTLLERRNIRHVSASDLPLFPDIAVVDVSFISLRLVLPQLAELLPERGEVVALVKPQFEVGKGQVGKGGVVRDAPLQAQAVVAVRERARELGFDCLGEFPSPLLGPKGNREFFLFLKKK
jgi:23S rRNA (cytidine1920-2'-O)/16S rRNA (cytidine1409-2'-O)-methyltransferase